MWFLPLSGQMGRVRSSRAGCRKPVITAMGSFSPSRVLASGTYGSDRPWGERTLHRDRGLVDPAGRPGGGWGGTAARVQAPTRRTLHRHALGVLCRLRGTRHDGPRLLGSGRRAERQRCVGDARGRSGSRPVQPRGRCDRCRGDRRLSSDRRAPAGRCSAPGGPDVEPGGDRGPRVGHPAGNRDSAGGCDDRHGRGGRGDPRPRHGEPLGSSG